MNYFVSKILIKKLIKRHYKKRLLVCIDKRVFSNLLLRIRLKPSLESCGMIKGNVSKNAIKITHFIFFQNLSKNPTNSFRIQKSKVKTQLSNWLIGYNQVCGTFHSHTNSNVSPSSEDIKMMRKWAGIHMIIEPAGKFRIFLSNSRIIETNITIQ